MPSSIRMTTKEAADYPDPIHDAIGMGEERAAKGYSLHGSTRQVGRYKQEDLETASMMFPEITWEKQHAATPMAN